MPIRPPEMGFGAVHHMQAYAMGPLKGTSLHAKKTRHMT